MQKIGTVRSILNDELLLVESTTLLNEGDTLIAFTEIANEEIKAQTGLDKIEIPKGELVVRASQGNNIYLVATAIFKPQKRVIFEPAIGATLAASLSGLGITPREVVESIPKTNPVPVDKNKSLKIKYQREVTVGDAVAKKEGFDG